MYAYLQEAIDEVGWEPCFRLLLCAEVFENVRELLPVVHRLLSQKLSIYASTYAVRHEPVLEIPGGTGTAERPPSSIDSRIDAAQILAALLSVRSTLGG